MRKKQQLRGCQATYLISVIATSGEATQIMNNELVARQKSLAQALPGKMPNIAISSQDHFYHNSLRDEYPK